MKTWAPYVPNPRAATPVYVSIPNRIARHVKLNLKNKNKKKIRKANMIKESKQYPIEQLLCATYKRPLLSSPLLALLALSISCRKKTPKSKGLNCSQCRDVSICSTSRQLLETTKRPLDSELKAAMKGLNWG